mgnify:CR=1 FL=1
MYSYGVVVLEMITKRRPTSNIFMDGKSLPKWAQSALHGNWMDVIDPYLEKEIQDGLVDQETIYNVLALALACAKESPKDRPTMLAVLETLVLLKQGKVIEVQVDTNSDATSELGLLDSGTTSDSSL